MECKYCGGMCVKDGTQSNGKRATYANRAIENNRHYTVTMPTKKGLTTRS